MKIRNTLLLANSLVLIAMGIEATIGSSFFTYAITAIAVLLILAKIVILIKNGVI